MSVRLGKSRRPGFRHRMEGGSVSRLALVLFISYFFFSLLILQADKVRDFFFL